MASATWEKTLGQCYGERMQNVLAGTAFAPYAEEFGFGLYVIRGAYGTTESLAAHTELQNMLRVLAKDEVRGVRAITVQGKNVCHYKSVQAVTGDCTCRYVYEGTTKHNVYNVAQFKALDTPTQWLLDHGRTSGVTDFNEVVANEYSHEADESIPFHTDKNELLADSTEILSLSMGAPGVFCYEPNTALHTESPMYKKGWNSRKKLPLKDKRQEF